MLYKAGIYSSPPSIYIDNLRLYTGKEHFGIII